MTRYSIKDLENYTQIKAHTIRIWEQRYQLLNPKRTETNIRYYSEEDFKKILNINLLYNNGFKISKIALLSEVEIVEAVKDVIKKGHASTGTPEVDILIGAISSMEQNKINETLEDCFDKFGIDQMFSSVVVPLLIKIGELWQVNTITIAHEHLFSNLIRDFFILKTTLLQDIPSNGKKAILFLPAHEEHELSLLYYHYILKSEGYDCYYLGTTIPLYDLKKSIHQINPDLIVTNLIAKIEKKQVIKFTESLIQLAPQAEIRLGGMQAIMYEDILPKEVSLIQAREDLF